MIDKQIMETNKACLLSLRTLVFHVAESTAGVGQPPPPPNRARINKQVKLCWGSAHWLMSISLIAADKRIIKALPTHQQSLLSFFQIEILRACASAVWYWHTMEAKAQSKATEDGGALWQPCWPRCTHADSMAAGELAREGVRLPSGGGKHQIPRSYRRPFEM